jgi:YVTN family beta-propeller protein
MRSGHGSGNSVSAIKTATKQVIATIRVGRRPRGIAITPNGKEIYATNVGGWDNLCHRLRHIDCDRDHPYRFYPVLLHISPRAENRAA